MRARIYLFIIHRIVSISLTMIKKIVLAAALASGWLTAFAAYDGTVYETSTATACATGARKLWQALP